MCFAGPATTYSPTISSTIGAEAFNGRVRDGNGFYHFAQATGPAKHIYLTNKLRISINCFVRRALINENDQADRIISTCKLHSLLSFHTKPINVVVFHDSQGKSSFEAGFPLRCFQRLSIPYIATLQCGWRHNRSTRGMSIPVLSY